MLLAVPISTVLGFALGVLGYARPRMRPVLLGALDLMQTVPAFAYLIPLLLLFGFGPVVGLIASAIYATPPMVRNTMLGLDRVPADDQRGRTDERLHAPPAVLAGRGADGAAADSGRLQPDDHGSAVAW